MQAVVHRDRLTHALDVAGDVSLALGLFTTFTFQHSLLSTAGMGLMLLVALVRFAVRPRAYFSVWYAGYALLIVWGLVGALAGWATDRSTALAMCKTLCVGLGFVFVVQQLIVQRRDAEASLLACLAACLALVVYVVLAERDVLFEQRLGTTAGINPNDVAMMAATGYAIAIHRLCTRKRWYEALPVLLLLVAILLTGSRKGMLLIVFLPGCYLLWQDRKHFRRNLLLLLALLLLLLAAVFLIPALYDLLGSRFVRMVQTMLAVEGAQEGSLTERLSFLRQGWSMFVQRPLTGWGLDCFRFNGVTRATYSHNNYIELLVSGGVPALLLFYAPLAAELVRAVRRAGRDAAVRLVVTVVVGQMLMELLLVTYYERPQLVPIALLLGVSRLMRRGGDERDGTAYWTYLKNPRRLFVPLAMRGLFRRMADEPYLRRMYRALLGRKPDFDRPRTFNEKLNWMKLHDRDPRYVTVTDKLAARGFVESRVGAAYLVPLLGVWERPEQIDFQALPRPCVLKTTNDSGGVYILRDGEDGRRAVRFLDRHLRRDYASLWREWPYAEVPPRVLAEAFVGGADGALPVDYKIQCFDGRAFAVVACIGRAAGRPQYWYFDRDGRPLPVTRFMERHPAPEMALPPSLPEMLRVAERLSTGFAELRVDLYDTPDGVKVGELTLFDGGGFFDDYTEAGDLLLGRQLRLPGVSDGAEGGGE